MTYFCFAALCLLVFRLLSASFPRRSTRSSHLLRLCATSLAISFGIGIPSVAFAQQVLQRHVRADVLNHRAALAGAMPTDQQIHASIVLPLRNQAALTQLLTRLYDPASPDYRHFLSVAQFTDQFGPTNEDFQAVVAFAQANGLTVTDQPANRLIVPIAGTVAQVNAAFNVQMNLYQHPSESRTFFSPDREPSLALSVPIAHISGLDDFSLPHPMSVRKPLDQQPALVTGSGPGGSYLGSDMRAAYYGGNALDGNGQAIGLVEFGGYALSDVNLSFTNAGQTYKVPVNNVLLDGATGATNSYYGDGEQVLDIVQAIGMAPNLSQVRVYIGQGNDDPSILNSMASENIAKQLSCSWGWLPADPTVDDVFFLEMAAQGQSFFTASGDDGAFDAAISPYFYPADDQNVTAVGGTHLTTNGAAGAWVSETVWNSGGYGSGGGISPDNISIPSWQVGLATSANGGSTTLRNVPDVAMEGDFDNYACAGGVCYGNYAGTSFAAPRWAGFMALVNQQAVESGNAPAGGVGFINPALYRLAQGTNAAADFHDITSGNNNTANQPLWFSAAPGYDLTTGWGSAAGQHLIDDLAGPQVPGFWLASSQSTVGINPGHTATTTITITNAGGFSDGVTLAVSGLPTGVTAAFSSNPATGSSILTLTASASATTSSQPVTITGTSGTLTASTNVTVAVHTPNFSLSASPSTVGVNQGAVGTTTISVLPLYGFTDAVSLSISGLPTGVTAAFSPVSTTGTSTLTLTVGSTAVPNTTNLTVTGTSGTLTATTNVSLAIHGPSFTLSSTPSVSIGQGSTATSYVYVLDQYGFTGNVNLAVSGLPAGVTASFSTNPTTYSSVLTFTASSSATVGSSVVTVTGTSGQLISTATINLGVYAPTFTLSGNTSISIGQGNSASSYVYVNPQYGFTGSVTFSVSGLPTGVTALWTPNPSTGSSTLILSASSSAKVGQYPLTITGVSGSITKTVTTTLGVYVPTFTLSSYSNLTLGQGTTATSYVYINPQYGFTGSVTLAVTGLPAGVTSAFSTNPATGSSTLTLTASTSAAVGSYTATITGTSGTISQTTPLTFAIYAPTFTLSNYGNITVGQGATSTGTVYINAQYGFTGSVTLSVSGLPVGVTAAFSPNPTTGYGTLTATATSAAAVGQYPLTITGTSGTITQTVAMTLNVYKPTFTLSGYNAVNLGQGTSTSSTVSIYGQYGFSGSVAMSIAGLPAGVTAAFSPNPTTGSSTLTFTATSAAALGTYPLVITGTSGTTTATLNMQLGIFTPSFTMSAYSVSAGQGTSASSYIYVNSQYGFAGGVTLAVSGLPTGVTGSFSTNPTTYSSNLLLNIPANAPLGTSTVTVTGTSGSTVVTTTFQLTILAPSFSLSSSYSLALNQGASGTAYVYVYGQNGFTGSVALAASGLPSGVTASFSPTSTTNSSVLTLTAGSNATPGLATITITGTSGATTASTTLQLTINSPGFTITAAPPDVFLTPGSSQKSTVAVVPTFGFASSVNYVANGLPTGVTATFSPNPATGPTTLTFTAAANATPVSGTVTVTGTSGSLTATAALLVAVRTAPGATTTTLALTAGGKAASSVASPTLVTATAKVASGSTNLTTGQINFCDATATLCDSIHLLGSAQLTTAGTAVLQFIPGPGAHSYKAVFAGTTTNGPSASDAASLTVTASQSSKTTIAQTGTVGNYKLTATVTGLGPLSPSGKVAFVDTTAGNAALGSGTLTSAASTLTLGTAQSVSVGTQPVSVATSDFNGDGIPDLAVANYSSSNVSILLGNGDSTFTPAANLQTGSNPITVVAGDFNRDGIQDLAVLLNSNSSINVFLGKGDGTFTPSTSSPQTGGSPVSMALGDYNGDGLLDLAVINGGNGTLTVLLGNGDGTFTPFSLSPLIGSQPNAIARGDFNGDGIQDLAITNSYGSTVTIFLGAGDGSFGSIGTVTTGSYPVSIAVGDLNADGKLDLVIGTQYGSTPTVLLGHGDGTFTAATGPSTGSYSSYVALADLNGDGNPDIITSSNYTSAISIALGNGDGTFATPIATSTTNYPGAITVADWNGDGIKDIVATNNGNSTLTVFTSQLAQKATASATGISPIGQGSHAAAATYAGDTVFATSTSATTNLTASAGPPTVTLTLTSATITTAQPVTVTIAVTSASSNPIPTGSIKLTSGSYTSAVTTLANGTASITIPAGTLPVGTNAFSATYTPDTAGSATYTTAAGTSSVTVTQATPTLALTLSPTSITATQPFTVTVAVNGGTNAPTATGSITLTSGTYISAATPLTAGTASIVVPAGTLPVGPDSITATYTPDTTSAAVYTSASASVPVIVSAVSPVITWPTPAAITYGTAISATQLNATTTVPGTFTYSPAAGAILPAGTQTLSVTFTPTDTITYTSATSTVQLTVTQATPAITWPAPSAITYGTALSNAQLNATSPAAGAFTYSPAPGTFLPAGAQTLTATFTPTDTTNYRSATSTAALTVNKAALSLTAANATRLYGVANPAFTGAISGAVNGDTFTQTFSTTAVTTSAAGTYPIVPAATGISSANYTITPTNGTLTISPAGTTTTLALSNNNLTFTATVAPATTGTPTGTVTFSSGQTTLGTGTLVNGVATYTATSFPTGNVTLTAQYSGDTNFTKSTSASIPVVAVTMSNSTLTVGQAGTATDTFTFAVAPGYSGTLQFTCSNLPTNATCTFAPTSLTFSGNSTSAATTLTVHTGGVAALTIPAFGSPRTTTTWATVLGLPGLLALALSGRRRKLRTLLRMTALLLLLCGAASSLTACAGAGSSSSTPTPTPTPTTTPSGNYTIQVIATGTGGVTQTTSLSITVQ